MISDFESKVSFFARAFFASAASGGLICMISLLLLPSWSDIVYWLLILVAGLWTLIFGSVLVKTLRNPASAAVWGKRIMSFCQLNIFLTTCLIFTLMMGMILLLAPEFLINLLIVYWLSLFVFASILCLLILEVFVFRISSIEKNKFQSLSLPPDWIASLFLFLIAFLPRVSLTSYGLPYQSVWDEAVTYPQALRMLTEPGLKPTAINVPGYDTASYGDLLIYITAGGDLLGLLNGYRTQQVTSIQEYVTPPQGVATIFQAVHPSGIPLLYPRLLLALINSFAPIGIFLTLRRTFFVDVWIGFGAALVFAVFSREVIYYSSFILPDALATTLGAFLFWITFEVIADKTGKLKLWCLSGFLAGLVLSTVFRLVTILFIPVFAVMVAVKRDQGFKRLFSVIGGVAAGFLLTSPYTLMDLPNTLLKLTGFAWDHNLDWTHRISSVAYYLQGMFMPGFDSMYIGNKVGSVGMGLLVGALAWLGLWKLLKYYPRQGFVALTFLGLHLYMISSITQRYTRHALILYPLVCIAAGLGLQQLAELLQLLFENLQKKYPRFVSQRSQPTSILVFSLFLLASSPQLALSIRYVNWAHQAKPSQVQAADYLEQMLQPGEKVGIIDVIPWVEADLRARNIAFERISIHAVPSDLRKRGITYLVGSDLILPGCGYGDLAGTFWETDFKSSSSRLAEFGYAYLQCSGYPNGDAYLFVGRVP